MIADSDDERGIIYQNEFIRLSIRQMILILASLVTWVVLSRITAAILPVPGILAGLVWIWVGIGGVYLALRTVDGRPLEFEITDRIMFMMSPQRYSPVTRQRNAKPAAPTEDETDELYW